MKRDVIILSGMALAIFVALRECRRTRLICTKLGFALSAILVCVGLAYFGWLPLFGGSHTPETLFGSLALSLGLLGFCLFGVIEEIFRKLDSTTDPRQGFPVMPVETESK